MKDEHTAIKLAEKVYDSQIAEYESKQKVARYKMKLEQLETVALRVAYRHEKINPKLKVAQLQKAESLYLHKNKRVRNLRRTIYHAEHFLAIETAKRRYNENMLSLYKAQLYSQSEGTR